MVWEGWGGGGVVPWRAHVHLVQVIPVVFSPTFSQFFLPQVLHALLLLPLPSPGAGQHLHSIPRQPRTQSEL